MPNNFHRRHEVRPNRRWADIAAWGLPDLQLVGIQTDAHGSKSDSYRINELPHVRSRYDRDNIVP